METTYRIVEQPGQSRKRGGVFIKYKIIAFVAVVVLAVAISLVLLAAFLGPGRENSGSEHCDNSSGKPQASSKSGIVCHTAYHASKMVYVLFFSGH